MLLSPLSSSSLLARSLQPKMTVRFRAQTDDSKPDGVTPESTANPVDPSAPNTGAGSNNTTGKEKPSFFKRVGQTALALMVNGFQIGAAVFVLAAVPFLHMPLWVGLTSMLGTQLLQSWVDSKFPNASVRDPKQMKQITTAIMRKIDKGLVFANRIKKIPLVGWILSPLVKKPVIWGRKLFKKAMDFVASDLLVKTIQASKIPDHVWKKGFFGKAWYFTQVVLSQTITLITGPFGKVGQWIAQGLTWLFRLKDAAGYIQQFAQKPPGPSKPGSADSPASQTPPPSPPPTTGPNPAST